MAGLYLDTSALGRVLLAEPDADAISAVVSTYTEWWSSELLAVELRRLAARESRERLAEMILSGITLHPVGRAALQAAARIEPMVVRTLDAIHLEAAVALAVAGRVAAVMTYDRQLAVGCAHHDLAVTAPTADTS